MRIVGWIDEVEPEAFALEIVEREVQVLADDLPLAQPFLAGFFAGAFLAAGFASAFSCGALLPGSSFRGFAGFGLPLAFSTGPLAGSSGSGLSWALPFFAAAFFAFGLASCE